MEQTEQVVSSFWRNIARRGTGGNKLRTYRQMKSDFQVEPYCLEIISRKHRGSLAKFRSGTAPIKVEIGVCVCGCVCVCVCVCLYSKTMCGFKFVQILKNKS